MSEWPIDIIRRWDPRTPNSESMLKASSGMVRAGLIGPRMASSRAIGHGLRAMLYDAELFEAAATIVLDHLDRSSARRPALRLATACLVASFEQPGQPLATRATRLAAGLLDDPKLVRPIPPALRLDAESLVLHCLGPSQPRGRSAMAMSLLQIVADSNVRPKICTAEKQRAVDYIGQVARDSGIFSIAQRAAEAGLCLYKRNVLPRTAQKGRGLFYGLGP